VRVLVSSNSIGEGAMIAAIALSEPRPSSVVVRASKSLATSDWNGNHYSLITNSLPAVGRLLDEMGIESVELHSAAGGVAPPDLKLLQETLRGSSLWRQSAETGGFELWSRVSWPGTARRPLRIDLSDKIGLVIQETETPPGQSAR
jgi:hypothetical protein